MSNSGVREIEVEAIFSDQPSPSKSRFAPQPSADYSTKIIDLNSQELVASPTVYRDGASYRFSTNITRLSDVRLELYHSGTLAFTRILGRNSTANDLVEVRVNNITHLQTQMVQSHDTTKLSYDEAIATVNLDIFGQTAIAEPDYVLGSLMSSSANCAAIAASYGRLFSGTISTATRSNLQQAFLQVMSKKSSQEVVETYTQVMNGLSPESASALAAAHEGAKNDPLINSTIPSTTFDSLKQDLVGNVAEAFDSALESPFMPPTGDEAWDHLRLAAPGILFTYTYPEAQTLDVLGIESYKIDWKKGSNSPKGRFRFDTKGGRELRWIPSPEDRHKEFSFNMTVKGVNGKSIALPELTVEVGDLNIKTMGRTTLPAHGELLTSPSLSSKDLYFATKDLGTSFNYLNKASLESLINASDKEVSSLQWQLPPSLPTVHDMEYRSTALGNFIYLASGDYGVSAYDADFSKNEPYSTPEQFLNKSIAAQSLTFVGDQIFCRLADGNVMQTDLSLSSNTKVSMVNDVLAQWDESKLFSINDEVLLASSNIEQAGFHLDVVTGELNALEPFSLAVDSQLIEDSEVIDGTVLNFLQSGNVHKWLWAKSSFQAGSSVGLAVPGDDPLLTNGSMVFHLSDNTMTLSAVSTSDNALNVQEEPYLQPLYYPSEGKGSSLYLQQEHQNDPEASLVHLFSCGRIDQSGNVNNWAFRAHRLKAVQP